VLPSTADFAVVLRVVGLPEPPIYKPDDTMPFLLPEKVWKFVIAKPQGDAISKGFSE
jgi:hypothetical protein